MNQFKEITPETLKKNPFHSIGKEWMLITAGNEKGLNAMTASWGGLGVMYGKDVAFTVIRPQRYTKEFVDREETFSLNFFGKEYKKMMNYMGSASGRNEDKIAKSGLTVVYSDHTPYFNEASHVLICKKLFMQPLSGEAILDKKLQKAFYPGMDYHTLYISEITKVLQITR